MDDSGQALDLPPNRCGFSYRGDFGGQLATLPARRRPFSPRRPKLIGTARPATHGLRTSTKNKNES